jgi:hypothetical protein
MILPRHVFHLSYALYDVRWKEREVSYEADSDGVFVQELS